MCSWLYWIESVLEIPWSEPAELWHAAVRCGMFRIKCLVFQVSQAPSKASQWFAERFCVGFILNDALECGSYLHFIGLSITKPSYLGTSQ